MRFPDDFILLIGTASRDLRRYPGFKVAALLLLCVLMIALIALSLSLEGIRSVDMLFSRNWVFYVAFYWIQNFHILLLTVFILLGLSKLDFLQLPFERLVVPPSPFPRDIRADERYKNWSRVLIVALALLTLTALPALHLCIPTWARFVAVCLTAGGGLLAYWAGLLRGQPSRIRRLGRCSFPSISYDTASMGGQAREISLELRVYEHVCRTSPASPVVQRFLSAGNGQSVWQGFPAFFESLGRLLHVAPNRITRHQSTTQGWKHVIRCLMNDDSTIVYSDLEYPSMVDAVADLSEDQRLLLEFQSACLSGDCDGVGVEVGYVDGAKRIQESGRRPILLASHVAYRTGAVIDPVRLRQRLEDAGVEDATLIIDGAQAVGNALVTEEQIGAASVYLTCGHKWLLGKAALGIAVDGPKGLSDEDRENLRKLDQPFSRMDQKNEYTQEVVALEPAISLNYMLREFRAVGVQRIAAHNLELAQLFMEQALGQGLRLVPHTGQSGIVAIRVPNARAMQDRLAEEQMFCQSFEFGSNPGSLAQHRESDQHDGVLRFGFHYFMDDQDVRRLIESIARNRAMATR